MTMRSFVDKSVLFKQVDNSRLDEMNYNLWRKASIDASSSSSSHSGSTSPLALVDSLLSDSETITENKEFETYDQKKRLINCRVQETELHTRKASALVTSIIRRQSIFNCSTSLFQRIAKPDEFCTLYMDMSYDDRIFFGVHNFYQLKRSLLETQCNIDFSASDNKVSIIGQVSNVHKTCQMFISNSTLALTREFCLADEKYFEYVKAVFARFQQLCEAYQKVMISYRRTKPTVLVFNFLSLRRNHLALIQAMQQFQNELEYYQFGRFAPNLSTTIQIPANRRDLIGRSNLYIEQIQKKTNTKVELVRFEDCPQYQFENLVISGQTIQEVVQARFELVSRFTYELKFQVTINETGALVEHISKLSYDLKSIYISIEPCNRSTKIISINSTEKNIAKLFLLRDQLIRDIKTAGKSMVKTYLT